MLQITVPAVEMWDEEKEEFVSRKEQTLQLEHSLISLSKWESKWKKAFLGRQEKTSEETLDYIRCMTLNSNIDSETYSALTNDNIMDIYEYINDSMTATHFAFDGGGTINGEVVTSELVYYWMIMLNIPFECQKWHLNRLLTLIQVCNVKNSPGRKMSNSEILSRNAELNAARRKKLNTKG